MAAIAAILEIGFALFVLNRKANLLETWDKIFVWLVNRNRKFVLMEIPRWPSQSPSWKCILNFFWTERPTRSKLVWCITMICRSKSAKIILIGNQNWSSWQPCLKFILIFFYLNQKTNWLETSLDVLRWLVDQKQLKSLWLEIQDDCFVLFTASTRACQ